MKGKKFESELRKHDADEQWMFEGRWFIGNMPKARWIYITEYGPITGGEDIHHINENKTDDNIENLIALAPVVHREVHRKSKERGEYLRRYEIEPLIVLFNKNQLVTEEITQENLRKIDRFLDRLTVSQKKHARRYLDRIAKEQRTKKKFNWKRSRKAKQVHYSSPEQAMKNIPRDRAIPEAGIKPRTDPHRQAARDEINRLQKELDERYAYNMGG